MKEDPLMCGLYINAIGFYPEAKFHACKRKKPISDNILIYCIEGKGGCVIYEPDGKQQKFELNKNQFFVIPSYKAHFYWADNDNPWSIYWVYFSGKLTPHLVEKTVSKHTFIKDFHPKTSNVNTLFEEMWSVLATGFSYKNLLLSSVCLQHYLISLLFPANIQLSSPLDITNNLNVINATISFMKENISYNLHLKDIIDYTGYSSSRISFLFKQSTGLAPIEFFY